MTTRIHQPRDPQEAAALSARLESLRSWDSDWSGLKVVVTGIGVSGFAAADTLIELGAEVLVVDASTTERALAQADTLKIVGAVDVLLGEDAVASLPQINGHDADLVVTSPGWRPDQPLLAEAASRGVAIWGDIELAWRLRIREGHKTAEWLAITGTNGKTTTVGMTESILQAAGLKAIAVGNVGTSVLDALRDPVEYDAFAVELSSFQLHWSSSLSPLASVVLNVAEDHVDWHGSYESYLSDKARIYNNTKVAVVYNAEQRETERMVEEADVIEGCRAIGFTTNSPQLSMLGVVEGLLVDRAFIEDRRNTAQELAEIKDLGPVAPRHKVANALAAAALTRALGVSAEAVRDGLLAYLPGDHRIQPVARLNDILWVNDSKATNPHAAAAALSAFRNIVWIAGGLPKGVTYDELVAAHRDRLKTVVLIGADSHELEEALARHAADVTVLRTLDGTIEANDGEAAMRSAVTLALGVAEPDDTVLLAPAAASMDQFLSYAQRGTAFINAVRTVVLGEHPEVQASTDKE